MEGSAYTAPACMPDVTPAATSRGTGQGCGALRSGDPSTARIIGDFSAYNIYCVTIFQDQIIDVNANERNIDLLHKKKWLN